MACLGFHSSVYYNVLEIWLCWLPDFLQPTGENKPFEDKAADILTLLNPYVLLFWSKQGVLDVVEGYTSAKML